MSFGADFSFQKSIAASSGTEYTSFGLKVGATLTSQDGVNVNAGLEASNSDTKNRIERGGGVSADWNSRSGLNEMKFQYQTSRNFAINSQGNGKTPYGSSFSSSISFARPSYTPTIRMPMTRYSGYVYVKIGGDIYVYHPNGFISGSLSKTSIARDDQVQTKPAYGYMYYNEAAGDPNALMDFNRLNDGTYNLKTPIISVPQYTHDIFTINGEGTSGSFRAYQGNMGYLRDNLTKSRNGDFSLALDVGIGNTVHVGVDAIGAVISTTKVGEWAGGNSLKDQVQFQNSTPDYEGVYFRDPGEKNDHGCKLLCNMW